ncbi:hypothetical protein HRI_001368900 [Hibiscus trionum]|uniref:K Homology domain-containing protein n=1 Tax=Hibiscus trionum TaxID=183268 RepID=A0A9W7HGI6_HIBTR|nr:hypothetical protein HRI_001368900 [Hibiscus trionum]
MSKRALLFPLISFNSVYLDPLILFSGVETLTTNAWNLNFYLLQFSLNLNPGDTLYRVLCPSRKIGGVIGKGGNIVKALRQTTRAKITVGDSVLGCDERVIVIYSSSMKVKEHNSDEDSGGENEKEVVVLVAMEPCCAAQDALLKVHDRIVEEELGGMVSDDDNANTVVTARLLVPNNMVGCLLGRGGDVIQRLRSGTGATIRVLPADHLPACAMATDELVQISGKRDVTKRALYEVSNLLHQNPRKDLSFPVSHAGQNFPPSALPPKNSMWSHRNFSPRDSPPMPWMGPHGNRLSGTGPGSFSSIPPACGAEASAEFSMKILCPAGKIGGVIGKGGFNVKQLQQETGAGIHVEDASTGSDERVIRVSGIEEIGNPRSQTIDAILQLQNKTSELSEKGTITTRLLVPSSKVGCILGQGGHVINEMRRRTQADIRVCSKNDKPKCASEDEELVQISGNFGVVKDALAEIASRLRVRTLRDVNAGAEPASVVSVHGFGPSRNMSDGPPLAAALGRGHCGGFESFRGGGGHDYDYEPQNYSVPPAASRYSNMNNPIEAKVPENMSSSVIGARGSTIFSSSEVSRSMLKLDDPQNGGFEEFRGSSGHNKTAAQSIFPSFMAFSGQSMNAQQGSYPNPNIHQSSYQKLNAQYFPYQNASAQQTFQNRQDHHSTYHSLTVQQNPYPLHSQQGPYANFNAPPNAYQNYSAQQGSNPY